MPVKDFFIRQSWRSSYCGVYATAMFFSLVKEKTSRMQALAFFGLRARNPNYDGTTLREIARVTRKIPKLKTAKWQRYTTFSFDRIWCELKNLSDRSRLPTLLWFGIIHPDLKTSTSHYAVVTGIRTSRICLIDSLARQLGTGQNSNVKIGSEKSCDGYNLVFGAGYMIDPEMPIAILIW